jgi:hypothetical protein
VTTACRSLATALSKARFASGIRPKTYTTTWALLPVVSVHREP